MTAPDIIGDAYGLRDEERARGGRRLRASAGAVAGSGWTIGVIAAAISGVLGTAIFAAVSLSGGGVQPEEVLPGAAFAFAKVDFDPPSGQKLAVRGLSRRFPDAPSDELVGLRDELIRSVLEDEDAPLDFERDIEPWLGDRVAVAAFMNRAGEPDAVVAVQTSDEAATRRTLDKGSEADAPPAVEFRRGYAIIAEDRDSLDQALALADKQTLADDDGYQADRSAIADDQIVVAWADNEVLGEVFLGVMGYGDEGSDPDTATLRDEMEDAFRGRTVLGLRAAPRHVELEVVALDSVPGGGGADPTTLKRLPDSTVAAMYVHNVAHVAEDLETSLGAFGAMTTGLLPFGIPNMRWHPPVDEEFGSETSTAEGAWSGGWTAQPPAQCVEPPGDTDGGTTPCEVVPPGRCLDDPDVPGDDLPPGCEGFEIPEEVRREMAEAERRSKAMQALVEHVLPLLKSEATLSLANVPTDGGDPAVGFTAKVRAPGEAVSPVADFLRAFELDPRAVTTTGELLLAASDPTTLGALKQGGRLGADDAFSATMGDLGADTSAAFYVSLDALEKVADYPEELVPLRALGLVVTETPGRTSMRFRVVVDG